MVGRDSRSRSTSRSRSQHTSHNRNLRRTSRSRERYSQRPNPDSEYRSSQYSSRRSISLSRDLSPDRRGRENFHSGRSRYRSPEVKDFSRDYNRAKENITRRFTRPNNIGNGDDFFKSRREERSGSSITFWPDSDQISSTSEESDHKSKRSKKRLGADSEEYSRSKKSKSKKKEKSHKNKNSSRRDESPDYTSKRASLKYISTANKNVSQQTSLSSTSVSLSEKESVEERWPEKRAYLEDSVIGPTPAPVIDQKIDSRSYGSALLAGEAEAMAAYIQSGKRIPRRGEIGLKSDQIEMFEQQGFVMSGSRHQRMNAVRIRKENQIISAEEKRALLNLAQEEHAKRENKIIADLREMVSANRSEE